MSHTLPAANGAQTLNIPSSKGDYFHTITLWADSRYAYCSSPECKAAAHGRKCHACKTALEIISPPFVPEPNEPVYTDTNELEAEERARIADMRAAAATPAPRGFMSAKRVLCAAAYDEQFLNAQCRDENDLPEVDDLPDFAPDGTDTGEACYLAPRPSGTPSVFTATDYEEESLFDAPIYKSSEWYATQFQGALA